MNNQVYMKAYGNYTLTMYQNKVNIVQYKEYLGLIEDGYSCNEILEKHLKENDKLVEDNDHKGDWYHGFNVGVLLIDENGEVKVNTFSKKPTINT